MRTLLLLTAVILLAVSVHFWAAKPPASVENASGTPLTSVSVPSLEGREKLGGELFATHCEQCHGRNAAGNEGAGPPLIHIIYEPGHHADQSFFLAVRNGVRAHHWPFGDMPAQPHVGDEEVAAIVDYVRALQRANGIQ